MWPGPGCSAVTVSQLQDRPINFLVQKAHVVNGGGDIFLPERLFGFEEVIAQAAMHILGKRFAHGMGAKIAGHLTTIEGFSQEMERLNTGDGLVAALATLENIGVGRYLEQLLHGAKPLEQRHFGNRVEDDRAALGLAFHVPALHRHPVDDLTELLHILDPEAEQFGDAKPGVGPQDKERFVAERELSAKTP